MGRLSGRVAIVTGGSRGIGAAIAEAFIAEGATVVISSRKEDSLRETAATLAQRGPGQVVPIPFHVGDVDAVPAYWARVVAEVGRPTVLVNNAGTNPYFGPMLGTTFAAWDKTFDVNLKGPFALARALIQDHLATDPSAPARIINVSSILGMTGARLQGVYGMTKAALISMTQTLAVELGETGVRVNAIAPGIVETKLSHALTSSAELLDGALLPHTPLKRIGQPSEIAGCAVYLASDESSFMTGQVLTVDGGYLIG
jgi:NAD(P)-dependent dehydrogenase (short-subunit alcohol dehydrogenase family)